MFGKNRVLYFILISFLLGLINGCASTNQNAPVTPTTTNSNNAVTTTAPTADTKAESNQKGYIFQTNTEVVFINWTKDNDNKIVGQLQVTDLTKTGIQSTNHAFNGVIDGSNISITITGSILNDGWAGNVFTGSLEGSDKLTILFPSTNGMMNPVAFDVGSVADFNNMVATLEQKYAKFQSDMQIQAQESEQLKKQIDILKSIVSIDKQIKNDTAILAKVTYSDIISQYDSNLKQMQQHYDKLKVDANVQPVTSYQLSVVDYDLSTMDYDLSTMDYSDTVMQTRDDDLETYIKNLQNDIKSYSSIWSSYQAIGGQSSAITADAMSSAIKNAQSQIGKAGETQKSAQAQANSYNKKAKDLYNTADTFVKGLSPTN